MDPELARPFVESVCSLFSRLLDTELKRGEVRANPNESPDDFVALVGLSHPIQATISLSFPSDTAQAVVSRLVDTKPQAIDEELTADGLGELVNIVAGSAKEKLIQPDQDPVQLGLPVVIRGHKQIMKNTEHNVWLTSQFETVAGPFTLGVTFDDDRGIRVEAINPFIRSVREFCRTMLHCQAQNGSVHVADQCGGEADLVALIGLGGPIRGSAVLCFSSDTAAAVVGRMLETEYEDVDEDVIDGLAEIMNIVGGAAKKDLVGQNDIPFELTLPSVLSGKTQRIDHPHSIWVEIGFESTLGPFGLRVNFPSEEDSN